MRHKTKADTVRQTQELDLRAMQLLKEHPDWTLKEIYQRAMALATGGEQDYSGS